MRRYRAPTAKTVAALAGAVGLLMTFWAAPASASSTSPSPSYDPAKAKRVCARVPNVTTKVDNALIRIRAGAGTKGSIAWLQAQAAQADANGKTALAEVYRAKAKTRTDRIVTLQDRKVELAKAAAWCKSAGY